MWSVFILQAKFRQTKTPRQQTCDHILKCNIFFSNSVCVLNAESQQLRYRNEHADCTLEMRSDTIKLHVLTEGQLHNLKT